VAIRSFEDNVVSPRSKQRAGENAVQIVVHGDYVQGVTEERAREIALEAARSAMEEYSQEAAEVAGERIEAFDEILIDRLTAADLLDAFKDPGFQMSLKKAQIGAATSETEGDYKLLTELLVERVHRGADRPIRAGIERAIEVVDKVDPEALRGLTMLQIIIQIFPVPGGLEAGLDVMEQVYGLILADGPLPTGRDWMDHLDILDAVRVGSSGFKPFNEFFPTRMAGYAASGVPEGSDELRTGTARLLEQRINVSLLEHELKAGYLRLPFASLNGLDDALRAIPDMTEDRRLDAALICAEAFGLTAEGDPGLRPLVMERALNRPSIRAVADWWGSLPAHIQATPVGRVLARANAQRCDPSGFIADLGG
jgi:hypothetical protein